ncbi:hypothetical protein AGOR_G00221790 [Albula goreensis]|uniref:Uncharacterized protein n=1 Tax=Albula goreensis TaxID=1534307 RepID=A0A8T3CJ43_9TELE|nr:hypothetical protein AGOR_G00221790 [Albula goreensis]
MEAQFSQNSVRAEETWGLENSEPHLSNNPKPFSSTARRRGGPSLIMSFRLSLLVLSVAVVAVLAQRRRPAKDEWNYRDGSEKVSMRGVANLTQVLDNWRYDILNEMKNMLQNDHQSVLPDYARIQPLSEALDDLYKEFNALKSHLGDLTEKFAAIETFIDEMKAEKAAGGTATSGAAAGGVATAPGGPTRRRIIKKKAPPA